MKDVRTTAKELADHLRAAIQGGEYAPGQELPSTPALARDHGLSQTQVRRAIDTLRAEGLVDASRGKRTTVRKPVPRIRRHATERYTIEKLNVHRPAYERARYGSVEADVGASIGATPFEALIDKVPASPDIARVFGVPTETPLLRRRYRSGHPPMSTGASYLIWSQVEGHAELTDPAREPWPGGAQHQLWDVLGIELDRIVDEVTCRLPRPDEVNELDLPSGTAVFVIRKISISTEDDVVEVAEIILGGHRTELVYTIALPRWEQT